MEELARLTATYGFPMVVAFFLLVRLEKRLTELTGAINKMCYRPAAGGCRTDRGGGGGRRELHSQGCRREGPG